MTTTSYGIEVSPELTPSLEGEGKGKKVVFSRETAEDAKAVEEPKSEPKSKGSDK